MKKKNVILALLPLSMMLLISLQNKSTPASRRTKINTEMRQHFNIPDSGLIAHWTFDATGADVSGNNNSATLYNLTSTPDRFGNSTGAFYFNGTNSFANVADKTSMRLSNTDFTLNAWVKLDAYNTLSGSTIISKRIAGANNGYAWSILSNPKGAIVYNPEDVTNATSTDTISLSSWHMITSVYTVSTGQLSMYIDGVLNNTTSSIITPNTAIAAALYIGKDQVSNTNYLKGAIDDVRIYDRALDYSEIQNFYNVTNYPIDGIWNLQKDIEKAYTNGVLQSNTTKNYASGEAKITLFQGQYTLFENTAAIDTGTYNHYDQQIVFDSKDRLTNYNVILFNSQSGVLVISSDETSVDLNNTIYRRITESHFSRSTGNAQ